MGPWSIAFYENISTGKWRFEARHDNGSLTSASDPYDSFDEAYTATVNLFQMPRDFNTQTEWIKEWIADHITIETE